MSGRGGTALRRRLDTELVRRGLARSREHASQLIAAGAVATAAGPATKAATLVDREASIRVTAADAGATAYASRAAHKLIGALDELARRGQAPIIEDRVCLDAGASTGGFSDVLLRRGARLVHAVDVGYGQLSWRLQSDSRIRVHDRTNARHLVKGDLEPEPELVTADLSFISLRTVLPALAAVTAPGAEFLVMVKPQFEVGRERLPSGGVVRDPAARVGAVSAVAHAAISEGLGVMAVVRSPLPGPAGNVEFFLYLKRGQSGLGEGALADGIEQEVAAQ
ncbi:MAG: TlyA family RNA methyltransferase [Bifidobacteriaceae bacterium]|nr:TlyA family RNA methyltransferase [Bifidobacteriaceae bacterium]